MAETLRFLGKTRAYEVVGDELHVAELPEAPARASLIDDPPRLDPRTYDLRRVREVRLGIVGSWLSCDLYLEGGDQVVIMFDERGSRAAYGRLMEALHARLATYPGVRYQRGSWTQVGFMALLGVLGIAVGLALYQGWLDVGARFAGKATLLMLGGAGWVVAGPLFVWGSRPRGYDPRDLPRGYVS